MKKVILIQDDERGQKSIELKARKQSNGWKPLNETLQNSYLSKANKIVYLGHCKKDGDMFSLETFDGYIMIFRGKLNSGFY